MSDDEITPAELNALLEDAESEGEGLRIVDIRSPAEFDRGSIPGSENIPFQRLPQEVEELEGQDRIVTVCPHGKASMQAMRIIDSYEGTDGEVKSLEGGLEAWSRDYELEDNGEKRDPETEADAPF